MLIGRLGQNPDVNYLSNGDAVASCQIATGNSWTDKKSGERKENTEWHRVVFFNRGNYKLAEIAGEHLKKGSQVYIEGRLQTRKWQDKSGNDRYTTEIIAETMNMLGSKDGGSDRNIPPVSAYESQAPAQNQAAAPANNPTPPNYADFDDDIPF